MNALSHRLALLPHVLFKGRLAFRQWRDEQGGWERQARRSGDWSRNWQERNTSLAGWLERAGAGRLWLDHRSGPRWARRYTTDEDVQYAEQVLSGTIPRLGAEPMVGHPPAWRRDGYTAREWPLAPASRQPLMRGDGGDIRTVWELSRSYHFVLLARAYWRTGDARFLIAFQEQVESWIADNPPGQGPNWISPMDAAIRGANWAMAAVLLARAPGLSAAFWASLLGNLRLTAWYVERHLEWHPVFRGNHYISNGVGLAYLGALFRDDREGARWLRLGAQILEREMRYQVHADGVSFEASIGYHRLVTEFFSWGGEVIRQNLPGALSAQYWQRLSRMRQFIESYLDSEGRAPLIGDSDDGRLHHLCAEAARSPRLHRLGLPARRGHLGVPASVDCREGGFYVLRHRKDRCVVRCGPVGLGGAGSHDHNDQLSCELTIDGHELITDSGTYAYTRDLKARYAFRATAAHNAVQLGGDEQNPIRVDRPWRVLADRTRSECVAWEAGPEGTVFEGRHHGFAHRASRAICTRRIAVDAPTGEWVITDAVTGTGHEDLAWRLHLAPGTASLSSLEPGRWFLVHSSAPHHRMTLEAPGEVEVRLTESPYSERYGEVVVRPMVLLEGSVTLPATITLRISPGPAQSGGDRA